MHTQYPHHDTRRGSSRFKSAPGYARADAIADHRERERALDAVRAAEGRREDREEGVPTAHQVAACLADACALLLDPSSGDHHAAGALGKALRRVLAARGVDVRREGVARRFEVRLRPISYVHEHEARAAANEAVERSLRARQAGVATDIYDAFMASYDSLRDDD